MWGLRLLYLAGVLPHLLSVPSFSHASPASAGFFLSVEWKGAARGLPLQRASMALNRYAVTNTSERRGRQSF